MWHSKSRMGLGIRYAELKKHRLRREHQFVWSHVFPKRKILESIKFLNPPRKKLHIEVEIAKHNFKGKRASSQLTA